LIQLLDGTTHERGITLYHPSRSSFTRQAGQGSKQLHACLLGWWKQPGPMYQRRVCDTRFQQDTATEAASPQCCPEVVATSCTQLCYALLQQLADQISSDRHSDGYDEMHRLQAFTYVSPLGWEVAVLTQHQSNQPSPKIVHRAASHQAFCCQQVVSCRAGPLKRTPLVLWVGT
jgi:hypothetical protein